LGVQEITEIYIKGRTCCFSTSFIITTNNHIYFTSITTLLSTFNL
jgi:hypothetical protein